MAELVADVPVNLRWAGPSGAVYDLVLGPRHAREPIPAGTSFTIDDADVAAFLAAFGPTAPSTSQPRFGANHPIADGIPEAVAHPGLIPGLRRL